MRGEGPKIRRRSASAALAGAALLLLACASDGSFQRDAAACRVEARSSIVDVAAPPVSQSPRANLAADVVGAPDRGVVAYEVCMRGRGWSDPSDPAAGRTVSAAEYSALVSDELLGCRDDASAAAGAGELRRAADAFCACERAAAQEGAVPLELDVIVEADGTIARLGASPDSELARCLRRELLHTRLPAPPSAPWRTRVNATR